MKLSENLKLLVERHNLNTMELARRTGIGQPVIYRIISGETEDPKISTIATLSDYFDVSIDELIGKKIKGSENTKEISQSGIPLITWKQAFEWPNISKTQLKNISLINSSVAPHKGLFAVQLMDDSMAPLFCSDAILIIDANKKAKSCSYVVAKIKEQKEVIFRQLIIDGDIRYLKPLNQNMEKYKIKLVNEKIQIVGVLLQAIINY